MKIRINKSIWIIIGVSIALALIGGGALLEIHKNNDEYAPSPLSLPDLEIEGWYAHRESNSNILFTQQETLPDFGPYIPAYGFGEFIQVYSLPVETSPEEWAANQTAPEDVSHKEYKWDYLNGRRHLRVVHATPAQDAQTDYLFGYGHVIIVSFYPYAKLQEAPEERTKYVSLLYRVAALVDPAYSRDTLRANCAQEVPVNSIDDSSVDIENKLVTFYWWDGAAQENKNLTVAYEPENGFTGCSASVQSVLERVRAATGG